MKKIEFAVKLIMLFAISFVFAVCIVMPQYRAGYMAAFIDKLEREENILEPKIILMGDSNVAYGIDSVMIEKELGMPVVNMGMHGGLGETFCMDIAKEGIRQGDLIVIVPGVYYYEPKLADGTLAWLLLENDLSLLQRVDKRDYSTLLKGYPAYLKRALALWKSQAGNLADDAPNIQDRNSFNEYGDIRSVGSTNIMEGGYIQEVYPVNICYDLMDYFNEYNRYVQKKGATMVLAAPPFMETILENGYTTVEGLEENLMQALDFPVISDYKDYVYPQEYFYNTNLHLNDKGKEIRTMQLIEDIREWMNDEGGKK